MMHYPHGLPSNWSKDLDRHRGRYRYSTDINHRYHFYTNQTGHRLLKGLTKSVDRMMAQNQDLIKKEKLNLKKTELNGIRLYVDKPNLRKEGATWSEGQYSQLGLQRVYLRTKAFQRYTETWTLLERCRAAGAFKGLHKIRMVTIGGGPGFELLAARDFFGPQYGSGISLDLEGGWEPYVSGDDFHQHDFLKDPVPRGNVYVFSNVFSMYLSNAVGHELVKKLIRTGRVLITDRAKKQQKSIKAFREFGNVRCLLPKDDRQLLVSKKAFEGDLKLKSVFPGVPY